MKTVAELTGIPRNTLVAWERRYGVPEPERLGNGYRLYSDEDVALVLRLRDALANGLSISEAVELVREGGTSASPDDAAAAKASGLVAIREGILEGLLAYDRPRAERLVERILNVPYLSAIEEVYFPILRAVGDRWETGQASVAQEHFVTAFVRDQLVAMLLRVGAGRPTGPRVACATFPGEKHELALLALAVHLSLGGCRVTYLGADVPRNDLCRFLKQVPHDCLCVSVILATEPKAVMEYARALAAAAPEETRIIIGGAGLPELDAKKLPKGIEVAMDWRHLAIA